MSAQRALRRELTAAQAIPYAAEIADGVVVTTRGDYVLGWRIGGVSFETADDEALNAWHERLHALLRNLASPQVALWLHIVRQRAQPLLPGESPAGFARQLARKYALRLSGERLMANEWYLTLVYRAQPTLVGGAALGLFARAHPEAERQGREEALEACEKLAAQVEAALAVAEPERLATYVADGRRYSGLLAFLGQLVNGERCRVPLPRAPVNEVLPTSRLLFGSELLEQRLPTATRFGAFLGIKEYPTPTGPGLFNRLLTAPFPFVLTQSFAFLAKSTGQALLARQYHRMVNSGDLAISQAEALKAALDALASNEFALGDHHFALQVQTEAVPAGEPVAAALRGLNDSIALARTWLGEAGMVVAREDLALEAGFWAQLPGNFSFRPRRAPITTRNLAGMAPLHDFPAGRARGNHWGEALALFKTSAGTPYHFSLHASDPRDPDGGSRRDTGHTFICGPTGSGKTVFLGFCVAMLARFGASQVLFDKDRGLEILVRALGGEYLAIRRGRPTGCNPLALPRTATNDAFQRAWLRRLTERAGRGLTAREEAELEQALAGTWALPAGTRRLSRLVEFLDPTDAEGVQARLARWCERFDGPLAWVFDAAEDRVAPLVGGTPLLGFDVTEFLDDEVVRGPLTGYLFHLVQQLLDGRRLVVWMDEFARVLADPAFEDFARDGLKTWRKLNAVAGFATQSPSDVLASPLARTLIEQTPTKVFFPNADANRVEYVEGFGLSAREFELVRTELSPGSRRFLVKQGAHSVVCELDLKGFEAELTVISGRAQTVARMEQLIAEVGADPARWLPRLVAATADRASR